MKVLKKMMVIGLASLLACAPALGGCGKKGGGSESGTLRIRYFVGGYGEEWIVNAAKSYQKANPDVKVELEDDNKINDQISNYLVARSQKADLYMVKPTNWQEHALEGLIEPIDDVMSRTVTLNGTVTTIKESLLDGLDFASYVETIPGKTESAKAFAMPWAADSVSIIYNNDLLTKTPKTGGGYWTEFPTTDTELLQLVADINAAPTSAYGGKEVAPFVYAGSEMIVLSWLHTIWWAQYQGLDSTNCQAEGSYADFWQYENAEIFKQTGLVKAYELMQNLFVDTTNKAWTNIPANNGALSAQQAEQAFIEGKGVMTINGAWMGNEVIEMLDLDTAYPDMGTNMRMATLPKITGAKAENVNLVDVKSVMLIPAKASEEAKGLAKDFLAFLSTEAQIADFAKYTGTVRPFKSTPTDLLPAEEFSPFEQDVMRLLSQKCIFEGSSHPMYVAAGVLPYPPTYETIFGDMRQYTAAKTAENAYIWAKDSWAQWKVNAGLV